MANNPSISFPGTTVGLKMISVHTGQPVSFLKENGRYEYELDLPGFSLREVAGIISHSRISHGNERGLIEPGSCVGLLKLQLLDPAGVQVAESYVEVHTPRS